jgi:hypothetical protein
VAAAGVRGALLGHAVLRKLCAEGTLCPGSTAFGEHRKQM